MELRALLPELDTPVNKELKSPFRLNMPPLYGKRYCRLTSNLLG
jgi:hypothetical protein